MTMHSSAKPLNSGPLAYSGVGRCSGCNTTAARSGGTTVRGRFYCCVCGAILRKKKFARLVDLAKNQNVSVLDTSWHGGGIARYSFVCALGHTFTKGYNSSVGKGARPLCVRCAAAKKAAA